jgi:hypothetical protein
MRYKQAKEFLFYFLKNEIWFTTNYNWEWLWNCHNDNHQNPILHKLVSIKHHHWNIYLLWDFINFIHVIVQSIFSGLGFQDLDLFRFRVSRFRHRCAFREKKVKYTHTKNPQRTQVAGEWNPYIWAPHI